MSFETDFPLVEKYNCFGPMSDWTHFTRPSFFFSSFFIFFQILVGPLLVYIRMQPFWTVKIPNGRPTTNLYSNEIC